MDLRVEIVCFVSAQTQPGVVECELIDAEGRKHSFVDKVPIFSLNDLDDNSSYRALGVVGCEELARWQDPSGRELMKVTTRRDGVESKEGLSEFVVLRHQVQ